MSKSLIICSYCGLKFLKDNRHINENKKLGHQSYCSLQCQSLVKNKQIKVICENLKCKKKFKKSKAEMSFHNFCSRSCSVTFNNIIRSQNLLKRTASKRKRKPNVFQYCQYCGTRVQRKKYCSIKCWGKDHEISNNTLIKEIKKLSFNLGRVPTRRECKYSSSCQKHFGSWNEALIKANLIPHRSLNQRMYKRRQCIAKDGHLCNSVSELIIDNWFYENNIDHQKETAYPQGKFTADWSLSENIFVEYFGLANDSRRYDEEIKKKQRICAEFGLTLIEIYSKDLFPKNKLDQIFQGL